MKSRIDIVDRLHECKRGVRTATPQDYNTWWRYVTRLEQDVESLKNDVKYWRDRYSSPRGSSL